VLGCVGNERDQQEGQALVMRGERGKVGLEPARLLVFVVHQELVALPGPDFEHGVDIQAVGEKGWGTGLPGSGDRATRAQHAGKRQNGPSSLDSKFGARHLTDPQVQSPLLYSLAVLPGLDGEVGFEDTVELLGHDPLARYNLIDLQARTRGQERVPPR
jgi:hypothetical protein